MMYMPVPVTYMTGFKNTFGVAPKILLEWPRKRSFRLPPGGVSEDSWLPL